MFSHLREYAQHKLSQAANRISRAVESLRTDPIVSRWSRLPHPLLLAKRTPDQYSVVVNKKKFIIGSDKKSVDFWIEDEHIRAKHVMLKYKRDQWTIQVLDKNATDVLVNNYWVVDYYEPLVLRENDTITFDGNGDKNHQYVFQPDFDCFLSSLLDWAHEDTMDKDISVRKLMNDRIKQDKLIKKPKPSTSPAGAADEEPDYLGLHEGGPRRLKPGYGCNFEKYGHEGHFDF